MIIAMRIAEYRNTDIAKKYNVHPTAIHVFFKNKPYLRVPDVSALKIEAERMAAQLSKPEKQYKKWKIINLWEF